ncbi:hypothetical protein [Brevibacterium moorei]|nr:hypothetical protein [Brevibacterium sp. 68QC2CO]MCQ9385142.1 hypothetical protein [Brevibacterium sp. 68QC2CO]
MHERVKARFLTGRVAGTDKPFDDRKVNDKIPDWSEINWRLNYGTK